MNNITRTYERKAILIPKFGNIDNNLILVCCLYRYKNTIKVLRNHNEVISTITEFSKESDEKYKPVLCITHLDRFFKLFDLPIKSRFPLEGNSILEAVTDSGVTIRDTTKLGIDTGSYSWLIGNKLHSNSEIPDNIMSEMLKELDYTYDFVSHIKARGYTINQNAKRVLYSSISNLMSNKYKSVRSIDKVDKEIDIKRNMNKQGYEIVKGASKGGLCFVNNNYKGKTLTNVHSFDITSAYPYVMATKKMYNSDPVYTPWSADKNREDNIIPFDLINATPKTKGIDPYNVTECLGNKSFTLTGIELNNVLKFYDYKDIRFNSACEIWRYNYLPFSIRHTILNQFIKKENSRGKGAEYTYNKLLLNNFYGVCGRDPCKYATSIEQGIINYNANKTYSRFKYAIGASITGHVRNIMLDIIYKLGNDFVYCDTDCIKFINYEKNKHIFEEYNKAVRKELEEMRDNFTIPLEGCGKEGIEQRESYMQYFKKCVDEVLSFDNILGSFKYEGVSKKFKVLGKKKYIADENITFSGIDGKPLYEYLKSLGDVYKEFNCNLKVPYKSSGRKDMIEVTPFTITVKDMYGKESIETIRYRLATDWCEGMEIENILNHIS